MLEIGIFVSVGIAGSLPRRLVAPRIRLARSFRIKGTWGLGIVTSTPLAFNRYAFLGSDEQNNLRIN